VPEHTHRPAAHAREFEADAAYPTPPTAPRAWFDGDMISISREEFEEAVDDALDSLPEEIARAIAEANVVILVEEEPTPEQAGGAELLGLYEGVPLDHRSVFDGFRQPDRIFVFRGPLQRHARSREHLVREIAVTVLHELGHLFGISDARLHELGWG
jgi:predicted Zn-dependent protease with MMP-like domain